MANVHALKIKQSTYQYYVIQYNTNTQYAYIHYIMENTYTSYNVIFIIYVYMCPILRKNSCPRFARWLV